MDADDGFKEQMEAFVAALTPAVTNETHAWNLWNLIASDKGAIRDALLRAYGMTQETRIVRLALNPDGHVIEGQPRVQDRLVSQWEDRDPQ